MQNDFNPWSMFVFDQEFSCSTYIEDEGNSVKTIYALKWISVIFMLFLVYLIETKP